MATGEGKLAYVDAFPPEWKFRNCKLLSNCLATEWLLPELPSDFIRAPSASKPNKVGEIIRNGSEVSLDSACNLRSFPKKHFPAGFSKEFRTYSSVFSVILDLILVRLFR